MNLTQAIILIATLLALNIAYNSIAQHRNDKVNTGKHASIKGSKKTKFTTAEKNFMAGIALIPLLMGLWAINYWFGEYNMAHATNSWGAVNGTIISKKIGYLTSDNNHYNSVHIARTNPTTTHTPEVKYSFKHNGKTYTGTTLDYFNQPAYGDKSKAQAILDKLPEAGERITVYINSDASRSVLFRGTKDTSCFGILVGIPFFMAGLLIHKIHIWIVNLVNIYKFHSAPPGASYLSRTY